MATTKLLTRNWPITLLLFLSYLDVKSKAGLAVVISWLNSSVKLQLLKYVLVSRNFRQSKKIPILKILESHSDISENLFEKFIDSH